MRPDALEAYPKIRQLHEEVVQLEGIKEYLQSSKRYPFPKGEVGRWAFLSGRT